MKHKKEEVMKMNIMGTEEIKQQHEYTNKEIQILNGYHNIISKICESCMKTVPTVLYVGGHMCGGGGFFFCVGVEGERL